MILPRVWCKELLGNLSSNLTQATFTKEISGQSRRHYTTDHPRHEGPYGVQWVQDVLWGTSMITLSRESTVISSDDRLASIMQQIRGAELIVPKALLVIYAQVQDTPIYTHVLVILGGCSILPAKCFSLSLSFITLWVSTDLSIVESRKGKFQGTSFLNDVQCYSPWSTWISQRQRLA